MKILITEDDSDVMEYISQILKDDGHEVISSPDGFTGFTAYLKNENNKPDLIITDLRMPKKDGVDMIISIRKVEYNEPTPILVISGAITDSDLRRLSEIKSVTVLEKPLNTSQLSSYLTKLAA